MGLYGIHILDLQLFINICVYIVYYETVAFFLLLIMFIYQKQYMDDTVKNFLKIFQLFEIFVCKMNTP